jgi:vacuolar-type H+-ATPase subunit I/STV1
LNESHTLSEIRLTTYRQRLSEISPGSDRCDGDIQFFISPTKLSRVFPHTNPEEGRMKTIFKAALLLGLLCMAWQLVMGITGWYLHPTLQNLFWIVILIQLAVLVWGLRRTAGEGRSYWGQVGAGTLMSVFGGVIIFFGSLLFTLVLFPHYFEDVRKVGEGMLRAAGKSEADIKNLLDAQASMQTPFFSALSGFLGTVVTGFVISLIAGAFLRKKEGQAPSSEAPGA